MSTKYSNSQLMKKPLRTARRGKAAVPVASDAKLLEERMQTQVEYIPHPDFDRPGARRRYSSVSEGGRPSEAKSVRTDVSRAGSELSAYMADLCRSSLLTKEEEQFLFLRMNYLKHRAKQLQRTFPKARDKRRVAEEFSSALRESEAARDRILKGNLRLVVSIAKKYVNQNNTFDELISEGNVSLMQSVEKFDISRGNRFSTYATRAIRNNLYHYVLDKHRKRRQVTLADDEVLLGAADEGTNEYLCEARLNYVRRSLSRMMQRLDEQKQAIISSRFGLGKDNDPLTLKQVAAELGISRERVRQIQTRAIQELRGFADEDRVELPEYD